MLFKPEHIEPILAGRKTETRRLWKTPHAKVGSVQKCKTEMISLNYFAKIQIGDVHQEALLNISDAGAIAEGYANRMEYFQAFFRINKIPVPKQEAALHTIIYVVGFKCVENHFHEYQAFLAQAKAQQMAQISNDQPGI